MISPLEKLIELHATENLAKEFLRTGAKSNVAEQDVETLMSSIRKEKSTILTELGKQYISAGAPPPERVANETIGAAGQCAVLYKTIESIVEAFEYKPSENVSNVLPLLKSRDGVAGERCNVDILQNMVVNIKNFRSGPDEKISENFRPTVSWLWYVSAGFSLQGVSTAPSGSRFGTRAFTVFEADLRAAFEKVGDFADSLQRKLVDALNSLSSNSNVPQLGMKPSATGPTEEWLHLVEMVEEVFFSYHKKMVTLMFWGLVSLFSGDEGMGSKELFCVLANMDPKTSEVALNITGSKISDRLLGLLRNNFVSYTTPEFSIGKLTKVLGSKAQTVKEQQLKAPRFRMSNDKDIVRLLDDLCESVIARTSELDQEFSLVKDEMRLKLMSINQTTLAGVDEELKNIKYNFGPLERFAAKRTILVCFDVLQNTLVMRLGEKLSQLRKTAAEGKDKNETTTQGFGFLLKTDDGPNDLITALRKFRGEKLGRGKFDKGLDPEKYVERLILQQMSEFNLPQIPEGDDRSCIASRSASMAKVASNASDYSKESFLRGGLSTGRSRDGKDATPTSSNRAGGPSKPSSITAKETQPFPTAATRDPFSSRPSGSRAERPSLSSAALPSAPYTPATPAAATSASSFQPAADKPLLLSAEKKKLQDLLRLYPFLNREPLPGIYLEDLSFAENPIFRAAINRLIVKRNNSGVATRKDEIKEQEQAVNKVVLSIAQDLKEETLYAAQTMPFLPIRVNRSLLGALVPLLDQNETFQDHMQTRRKLLERQYDISELKTINQKLCVVANAIAAKVEPPVDEAQTQRSITILQRQVKPPPHAEAAATSEEPALTPQTPPQAMGMNVSPRPEATQQRQPQPQTQTQPATRPLAPASVNTPPSSSSKLLPAEDRGPSSCGTHNQNNNQPMARAAAAAPTPRSTVSHYKATPTTTVTKKAVAPSAATKAPPASTNSRLTGPSTVSAAETGPMGGLRTTTSRLGGPKAPATTTKTPTSPPKLASARLGTLEGSLMSGTTTPTARRLTPSTPVVSPVKPPPSTQTTATPEAVGPKKPAERFAPSASPAPAKKEEAPAPPPTQRKAAPAPATTKKLAPPQPATKAKAAPPAGAHPTKAGTSPPVPTTTVRKASPAPRKGSPSLAASSSTAETEAMAEHSMSSSRGGRSPASGAGHAKAPPPGTTVVRKAPAKAGPEAGLKTSPAQAPVSSSGAKTNSSAPPLSTSMSSVSSSHPPAPATQEQRTRAKSPSTQVPPSRSQSSAGRPPSPSTSHPPPQSNPRPSPPARKDFLLSASTAGNAAVRSPSPTSQQARNATTEVAPVPATSATSPAGDGGRKISEATVYPYHCSASSKMDEEKEEEKQRQQQRKPPVAAAATSAPAKQPPTVPSPQRVKSNFATRLAESIESAAKKTVQAFDSTDSNSSDSEGMGELIVKTPRNASMNMKQQPTGPHLSDESTGGLTETPAGSTPVSDPSTFHADKYSNTVPSNTRTGTTTAGLYGSRPSTMKQRYTGVSLAGGNRVGNPNSTVHRGNTTPQSPTPQPQDLSASTTANGQGARTGSSPGTVSLEQYRKTGMMRYAQPVVKKNASPAPPPGNRGAGNSQSVGAPRTTTGGATAQHQQQNTPESSSLFSTMKQDVGHPAAAVQDAAPLKVADLSTTSSSYTKNTANAAAAVKQISQAHNNSGSSSRNASVDPGQRSGPPSPSKYRTPNAMATNPLQQHHASKERSPPQHSNSTAAPHEQKASGPQHHPSPASYQRTPSYDRSRHETQSRGSPPVSPHRRSFAGSNSMYRTPERSQHGSAATAAGGPGPQISPSGRMYTQEDVPQESSRTTTQTADEVLNAEKEIERLQSKLAALEQKEKQRTIEAEAWATRTNENNSIQRQSRLSDRLADRPHSQPDTADKQPGAEHTDQWKSASYSAGTANAILDPVEQLYAAPSRKETTGLLSPGNRSPQRFHRGADTIGSPSLPKMDATKIRSLLHFRRKQEQQQQGANGTAAMENAGGSPTDDGMPALPAAQHGGRPVISATVSRTRYVRDNGPRMGPGRSAAPPPVVSTFNDTNQSNTNYRSRQNSSPSGRCGSAGSSRSASVSLNLSSPYANLLREQEEKIQQVSGRNGAAADPGKAEFFRSITPPRSGGNSPRRGTPAQRRTSEALKTAAEVARVARKRPVIPGLSDCQSLADVYVEACKALGLRPNSVLLRTFPSRSGEYLEKIDLSINYVGAKGLQPLFYVMEENSNRLQHLNLSSNNLENTEVLELLEVLCGEAGERLASLDLSYNPISQSGGQAIYRLSKARPNLVAVQLKGTLIPPRLLQSIVENVEENAYRHHIGIG